MVYREIIRQRLMKYLKPAGCTLTSATPMVRVPTQLGAFELGRQNADLFMGFSCFLLEQSRHNKIEKLCFCTREGTFFKLVFDTLFEHVSGKDTVPETRLLEVSRLSTVAPSLLLGKSIEFNPLFRLYKKQTPRKILTSLGQTPDKFVDLIAMHGLLMDELFEKPMVDTRLNSFLADKTLTERIYPHLAQQRSFFRKYLENHLGESERIGIVDIGWHGTIQNSIARVYSEKKFFGMYLGLALKRFEMNSNCQKIAYGPDRNLNSANSTLLNAMNVLEFICLSTGGSAEGYDPQPDGSVNARMRHLSEEDRCVEEFSIPFQQGVLAVASETDPVALFREHQSGELKINALDQWRRLLTRPDESLVKSYFSLKSNEKFGHGAVHDQSITPPLSTVFLAPFSKSRRHQLITFLTNSQWAEGMRHRSDVTLRSKLVFYPLMKTALIYKSLLHSSKSMLRRVTE